MTVAKQEAHAQRVAREESAVSRSRHDLTNDSKRSE